MMTKFARWQGQEEATPARLHGSANLRPGGHASHFQGGICTPTGLNTGPQRVELLSKTWTAAPTGHSSEGLRPHPPGGSPQDWDIALTHTTHSCRLDDQPMGPGYT